jgi:hypothetical protein
VSSWDQIDEIAKQEGGGGGGGWVQLRADGDKFVGVFLGEPQALKRCFVDGKYVPATPELEANGIKASVRVAINVAVLPSREVKIFEMGMALYKDLRKVQQKYGLDSWAFEIQRNGGPKDPKTTYSILPERQLAADEKRALVTLSLKDLDKIYQNRDTDVPVGKAGSDRTGGFDEIVDEATATEIMTALKGLPREAVERFCERFGVERIRQVPKSLSEKARSFVTALRTEYLPPANSTVERDPFA